MPEFTASDPGSSFPNQNILFNSAAGITGQQIQQNQLGLQSQQMQLTAADHEQVGRLAAGLLAEPDLGKRGDLYSRGVGMLQSQGLAKYAPPTLPDESTLRMLVSQSLPVTDQYKLGVATPAGTTAAINAALTPGQPGYGGAAAPGAAATPSAAIPARGTGGPGASASAPTEWLPYFEEASKETGIPVDLLLAQARQESSFNPNNVGKSGEIGLFQIMPSTARSPGPGMQGVDPATLTGADNVRNNILFGARYLKSKMGGGDPNSPAVQAAALHAYNGLGVGGDPNYVQNVFRYRPTLAPSDPNAAVTAYTPPTGGTTTAAAAPAGGGGTPGPYRVASTAPTAPPGSTAAPAQPGQPQPAPAPAAAAPIPPSASSQANLPHASEVPTGANSQQYQQAMDLQRRAMILDAQPDPTGRLKTLAAGLRSQAALALQNDSVVNTQEGQLHTLTGKLDDPAKPLADYHETTPGSGIWVGGPGTEPKFQPPGRLIIDKAGDVWRTTTGGAEKLSRLDPAAVAALNEAAAAGTATGTAVAKQLPELMAQARNAASQEGQIDYATNQLREATKGGIPTGYFSQGLATAAAAAKSLGLDGALRAVGVNPEAVGNVQTAQKTLSVIGGAILRQALGPGSAVTDAKVEQFIHTQPGIETDPQALQRIMAWARSQFTYERELGTAAVAEAAKPENAGRLPPHFLAAYYRDHGFAPIYDTGTQEMQQPDGRQPSRETPPPASTKRPPLSSFQK